METKENYDVVIIGGGPAGLTSAIYSSRGDLNVLVIEKEDIGDLISAHKIDNYPGFYDSPTGKEVYESMKKHAKKFGTKFVNSTVLEIDSYSEPKVVKTDKKNYSATVVIVATGTGKKGSKKLPGEEEYLGKGVSYCATCDGAFYKNQTVGVFGNGNEVAEETLFLTQYVKNVKLFIPDKNFIGESELLDQLTNNEKIDIYYSKSLKEIKGEQFVSNVDVFDIVENSEINYNLTGCFLFLGTKNNFDLYSSFADLNEKGFIKTDEKMNTFSEGVFAVGDVREKYLRQIATAVSDGAIAGVETIKFIIKKRKATS